MLRISVHRAFPKLGLRVRKWDTTAGHRVLCCSSDFSADNGFLYKSDRLWGTKYLILSSFKSSSLFCLQFPFPDCLCCFSHVPDSQTRIEVPGVRILGAALPCTGTHTFIASFPFPLSHGQSLVLLILRELSFVLSTERWNFGVSVPHCGCVGEAGGCGLLWLLWGDELLVPHLSPVEKFNS